MVDCAQSPGHNRRVKLAYDSFENCFKSRNLRLRPVICRVAGTWRHTVPKGIILVAVQGLDSDDASRRVGQLLSMFGKIEEQLERQHPEIPGALLQAPDNNFRQDPGADPRPAPTRAEYEAALAFPGVWFVGPHTANVARYVGQSTQSLPPDEAATIATCVEHGFSNRIGSPFRSFRPDYPHENYADILRNRGGFDEHVQQLHDSIPLLVANAPHHLALGWWIRDAGAQSEVPLTERSIAQFQAGLQHFAGLVSNDATRDDYLAKLFHGDRLSGRQSVAQVRDRLTELVPGIGADDLTNASQMVGQRYRHLAASGSLDTGDVFFVSDVAQNDFPGSLEASLQAFFGQPDDLRRLDIDNVHHSRSGIKDIVTRSGIEIDYDYTVGGVFRPDGSSAEAINYKMHG